MKHPRLPDWLAERALAGELPAARARDVRELLDREPEAREQVAALERSNAEILETLPPAMVAEEVRRRAGAEVRATTRRRTRVAVWTAAAAAVAAILLFVFLEPGRDRTDSGPLVARDVTPPGDDLADQGPTRAKGDPRLVLHRKRGNRVDRLDARGTARAGDRIQISYLGGGRPHGVVLSMDGAGVVTLHYPESPDGFTRLLPSGLATLAHSYELDDAPGFERFLLLTSDQPIDVAAVLESAELLARDPLRGERDPLPLPPHLVQRWTTLRKETSP